MLALGVTMLALAGCMSAKTENAESFSGRADDVKSATGDDAALAAPGAQTRPLPPSRSPSLASLSGLTAPALRAALGDPVLLHRDGPAQLWQYAGIGCVLHVFLYEDNGAFRVSYAEVRIDNAKLVNPPTCVGWLPNTSAQITPTSTR
jgi:hypothetical protein